MNREAILTYVMAYIAVLIVSATVAGLFLLPDQRAEFGAAMLGELGVVTGFFFGQRTSSNRRSDGPPA